jgi:hypothetical protein
MATDTDTDEREPNSTASGSVIESIASRGQSGSTDRDIRRVPGSQHEAGKATDEQMDREQEREGRSRAPNRFGIPRDESELMRTPASVAETKERRGADKRGATDVMNIEEMQARRRSAGTMGATVFEGKGSEQDADGGGDTPNSSEQRRRRRGGEPVLESVSSAITVGDSGETPLEMHPNFTPGDSSASEVAGAFGILKSIGGVL